jgi:organic radical activating enzyme
MQSPKVIPRLDLMVAYSCNISCAGCISLSDFKRDGIAKLGDINSWVSHWSQLVQPTVVTLFGGEPCLHPDLIEICKLVRLYWPTSTIRLITNGYLLNNFDSESWFNFEPFEIQVSMHRSDHRQIIDRAIKNILVNRSGWKTTVSDNANSHKQISWQLECFTIYKSIFKDFVVPFKLVDGQIHPWMSQAESAHKICGAPNTPVLYKGMLYKCPAVANAMDLSQNNWFGYQPCQDADTLDKFVAGIGCPEIVCQQCPDRSQAVIIDHMDKKNVVIKQKNLN